MAKGRINYTYRTPLGEFASAGQAASAHKCDRATIINRCKTDTENYQRQVRANVPYAAKKQPYVSNANAGWPITWARYRYLPWESKEVVQAQWIQLRGYTWDQICDDQEVIDQFFAEMDAVNEAVELDEDEPSEIE